MRGFNPGDRVFGRCAGAFSGYASIDARETIPVPEHLSWEEAAAVPIAFMTVHDMLIAQGKLAPDEWLLVTGISAGVGVVGVVSTVASGSSSSPSKPSIVSGVSLNTPTKAVR